MSQQFEAVFENGIFRPLEPVVLPPQQRVTVIVLEAQEAATIKPPERLPEDEEDLAGAADQESPWRGVFVPPRQRRLLFTHESVLQQETLPKRKPS